MAKLDDTYREKIMAGMNKSFASVARAPAPNSDTPPWQPLWPNPADFPYNFHNLLERSGDKAIANVAGRDAARRRIAIVGAGYGGMTAARELYRCGFTEITIYEATDRIGGRAYTVLPRTEGDGAAREPLTPYELGAMRIPFFEPQTTPPSVAGNSVMAWYVEQYALQSQPFPNPGRAGVFTGIYMNDGYGPAPAPDRFVGMIEWRPTKAEPAPPDPHLASVYRKWLDWAERVQEATSARYAATPEWFAFWHGMVQTYELMNFRDVALAAPQDNPEAGNFGGLGLSTSEAELFYTIGAGDGSWGAFFDVAALYPIRTLLFGYANDHHLLGCVNFAALPDGETLAALARSDVRDSDGRRVQPPLFLGVAAVPEMHFFQPVRSAVPGIGGTSLHERMQEDRGRPGGIKLHVSTPVVKLDIGRGGYLVTTADGRVEEYEALILTPPGWALQMTVDLSEAFVRKVFLEPGGDNFWPGVTAWHALKMSHNITSAKVFFRLRKRYWQDGTIPQVIVTDTILQDVYGYALDTDWWGNPVDDPGVLLCAYTWEDDANKFLAYEGEHGERALAMKCLAKLDEVMKASGYPPMSDFVDADSPPLVWHWERQPFYRSCAKLYRAGSFDWNYALLTWNQNQARSRGIYFAGEFASLEGGWIEPAMRGALDAVIHLVRDSVPESEWPRVFTDMEMIVNYTQIPDWRPQPVQRMAPQPRARELVGA